MNEITREHLVKASRSGADITELGRRVGPSNEEILNIEIQLRKFESLWKSAEDNQWGCDPKRWPHPFNDLHSKLRSQILDFENTYI